MSSESADSAGVILKLEDRVPLNHEKHDLGRTGLPIQQPSTPTQPTLLRV